MRPSLHLKSCNTLSNLFIIWMYEIEYILIIENNDEQLWNRKVFFQNIQHKDTLPYLVFLKCKNNMHYEGHLDTLETQLHWLFIYRDANTEHSTSVFSFRV